MPQKKNPDAAELLRAKAPRIAGHLVALHGVLHGLPLTYNKDLQEDKEHLFDAADTLELCLAAADGMLGAIAFRRDRLEAAASDEFLAATDIADLLVRRGMPFREAHGVVGGLVRTRARAGQALSELTPEELAEQSDAARRAVLRGAARSRLARVKVSRGGTSLSRVGASSWSGARGVGVDAAATSFYDRPVVEVARDLIGCVVRHGECAGVIVEDGGLPRVRARLSRVRRADLAHRDSFGAPGTRVRLPLLRDPRDAERRLRARGHRRRGLASVRSSRSRGSS